jgi:DNA repair protein RadC
MERALYERPREKLRNYGVSALSLTELIQVVLGSGMAHHSSARLAKSIQSLMDQTELSYESLVLIDGIGTAKACQIIAAIELGRRMI